MKDCVQWDPVYNWTDSRLQWDSNPGQHFHVSITIFTLSANACTCSFTVACRPIHVLNNYFSDTHLAFSRVYLPFSHASYFNVHVLIYHFEKQFGFGDVEFSDDMVPIIMFCFFQHGPHVGEIRLTYYHRHINGLITGTEEGLNLQ